MAMLKVIGVLQLMRQASNMAIASCTGALQTGKQNMKAVFGFNVFDQQFIGLWQMRQFRCRLNRGRRA